MSKDDPLYPSSKKNYQVDSDNNNLGESNMIKEKVIKHPITFRIVKIRVANCQALVPNP